MAFDSFYEINGPEDAPVVVFSHALGGDLSMWDVPAAKLAGAYQILRYDLRGHGRSAQSSEAFALKDLAADVLQLLDQHRIERAHFCGLSLGGMIGQWLGLHAQDRLHSLALVDTAPQMGTLEQWNERIEQIERQGMSPISNATMSRWFTEAFRERNPATVDRFKSILEATSPAGYIACAKVVRDASLAATDLARYGSVRIPTLVVTGTFDSAAKPADCQAMAAQIPGSRYVELNAAHISPVEASAAFTHTLETFLNI